MKTSAALVLGTALAGSTLRDASAFVGTPMARLSAVTAPSSSAAATRSR
ncbi:unnamed protein product [Laminaria digitata]